MKTILASLAAVAALLLAGSARAQTCGGTPDSCLVAHAAAGCSDSECCSTVCALIPECCSITWDTSCAALADSNCAGLCGAAALSKRWHAAGTADIALAKTLRLA